QDVVGGRDRLEARLGGRLSRVQIGVKLLGELAVGLADLVGGGVRLDAEHLIRGLRRHQRVCRGSLPRCRVVAVAVAASMRTAKPMPILPPPGARIAVLMPTTWP